MRSTIKSSLVLTLAILGGTAVTAPTASAGAAVELLSHRAAYRLSLHHRSNGSTINHVDGALVMEWRASCEGWLSNQRLGFVADTTDGGDFVYDVRFSSWESTDDRQLRFNVRSFDDGRLFEEFRGRAAIEAADGSGEARYSMPAENVVSLPPGTIFPTEHLRRLISAARDGRLVTSEAVFDGSGPEALTTVTAVIGRAEASTAATDAEGGTHWPVSLAYYGGKTDSDTPDFQISFDLTENGVLHDVVLDYGDFALRGELSEIETFDRPSCD